VCFINHWIKLESFHCVISQLCSPWIHLHQCVWTQLPTSKLPSFAMQFISQKLWVCLQQHFSKQICFPSHSILVIISSIRRYCSTLVSENSHFFFWTYRLPWEFYSDVFDRAFVNPRAMNCIWLLILIIMELLKCCFSQESRDDSHKPIHFLLGLTSCS
jgi:hypothetical protein